MKSDFSRFLHHTLSHSDTKSQPTSSLSHSDLIGVSRSNKFATWWNLDYRVKPDNDNIENVGRSMVEMLGVLAIIGVLSVGAISGYSKAMMKHKINKATQEITSIITGIHHLYANQKDRTDKYGYDYDIIKPSKLASLGIIDSKNVINDYAIRNIFDGYISFGTGWYPYENILILYYQGLHKEECIALGSQRWDELDSFLGISIDGAEMEDPEGIAGCKENKDETYTKADDNEDSGYIDACRQHYPLLMEDIEKACYCGNRDSCEIIFVFE